jgi:hypothetical protein
VDLTAEEINWLTYIREEEKVARDVYRFLYDKWQSRIFKNISNSEQTHMDAVKTLLDRYGITDPVGQNTDPLGQDLEAVFFNQNLQAMYDELIDAGSVSLVDALEVGVAIEETDIADLTAAIASTTHNDIKTVYGNLLLGSLNHSDAFIANLAKR